MRLKERLFIFQKVSISLSWCKDFPKTSKSRKSQGLCSTEIYKTKPPKVKAVLFIVILLNYI